MPPVSPSNIPIDLVELQFMVSKAFACHTFHPALMFVSEDRVRVDDVTGVCEC